MHYKAILLCLSIVVVWHIPVQAQPVPQFGSEHAVTIIGLTHDAMEPFYDHTRQALFFNSLNAGGNTNLYYAAEINDTTFVYQGIVNGTLDTSLNHLDGVPSIDSSGAFYWVSMRGYPQQLDNLHSGFYTTGMVASINRIHGTINKQQFVYPFGWLIMDACVDRAGDQLYYSNALFDFSNSSCAGLPCEAVLEIGKRINDTTFNKRSDSDNLLAWVNDTSSYIVYAPQLSADGRELYYTRLQKGTINTEICVSSRLDTNSVFGFPAVLISNPGFAPEAASISEDGQKLYYHQKDSNGIYRLYLRYRITPGLIVESNFSKRITVSPNPFTNRVCIKCEKNFDNTMRVRTINSLGLPVGDQTISAVEVQDACIDMGATLSAGIYLLIVETEELCYTTKLMKN